MSRNPKKKRVMKIVYLFISSVFLFACSGDNNMNQNIQVLINADRAFSDLSVKEGMNAAFLAYCAKDGVLLKPDSRPVAGIAAVSEMLDKRDDSTVELTWEPIHAMVAKSGDLGYTYGIYNLHVKVSGEHLKGTYVSVWIQEDGQWKFVLDSGNEGLGEN